jgi:flagellar hook-associated protein 2
MAGISVIGVGSGMDINSLVTQLIAAERQPMTQRLSAQETKIQAQLSGLGRIKSALSAFQDSLGKLTGLDELEAMKVTGANDALFSVTATTAAVPGSHSLQVNQLAQAQKLTTQGVFEGADSAFGSGTLQISFGSYAADGSFTANPDRQAQTITIDPADNTLAGVAQAINDADAGVTADVVRDGTGYRLVLSSAETGVANAMRITVTDDDGTNANQTGLSQLAYRPGRQNLQQSMAAADASIVLDGMSLTNSSNVFENVLQGLSLDLKAADTSKVTQFSVAPDRVDIGDSVQAFVDAYNKVVSESRSLTAYNAVTQERGALSGDAGIRAVANRLQRAVSDPISSGSAALRSLADLGISTQRDGTLELDRSVLDQAITADPDGVVALFSGTAEVEGVADRLDDAVAELLDSGGLFDARTDSLNESLEGISEQRERLALRMDALEEQYRAKFTFMDQIINQLTATGNFLTQQFSSMSSSA